MYNIHSMDYTTNNYTTCEGNEMDMDVVVICDVNSVT